MRNVCRDGIECRLFKRKFVVCPLTRIPDIDGELIIVVRFGDFRSHRALITAHVDDFTCLKFWIRNAKDDLHGIVVVGHHFFPWHAKGFWIAYLRFKASRHHIQIVMVVAQTKLRLLLWDSRATFRKNPPHDGGILPWLLFHTIVQRWRIVRKRNGNMWHGGICSNHGHGGDSQ